jgi:hypothetical protein
MEGEHAGGSLISRRFVALAQVFRTTTLYTGGVTKTISLDPAIAAVIHDLVHSLDGPTSTEAVMRDIARARTIKPAIAEAFTDAGVLVDEVERAELAKFKPV